MRAARKSAKVWREEALALSRFRDVEPGTPVTVRMDTGELRETKTRSKAWSLCDGTPVILLEGISGGYLLTRVEVRS